MNLLFVCLGNICRSPAAEAVMNKLSARRVLSAEIHCDSAGLSGYHAGEAADHRMREALERRGYQSTSISRAVDPLTDFDRFDYIIVMDDDNYRELSAIAPTDRAAKKIFKMTSFALNRTEKIVPDPYYGGPSGFNHVIDILEDSCKGLLKKIEEKLIST